MIFFKFSIVSLRSTVKSNCPPVVGVILIVISGSVTGETTQPHPGDDGVAVGNAAPRPPADDDDVVRKSELVMLANGEDVNEEDVGDVSASSSAALLLLRPGLLSPIAVTSDGDFQLKPWVPVFSQLELCTRRITVYTRRARTLHLFHLSQSDLNLLPLASPPRFYF